MGRREGLALAEGVLGFAALLPATTVLRAQACTTQAKMSAEIRSAMADAAVSLADEVKAGSVEKLKSAAIPEYGANFSAAGALIGATAGKLSNDALQVTQLYQLDARNRKAGDTSDADFSCPLTGTPDETDFSISGLPPGMYGFAMVEATGDRPWLLSFLLRQDNGAWKLAGFYSHARTVGPLVASTVVADGGKVQDTMGHDGLWFWTSAREAAKAKQLWLAWLLYGQADTLLRPATFASSTNLDKLRAEQRAAAPPELADGIGAETPLVVKSDAASSSPTAPAPAAEYRFTAIASEGSEDGKRLNLVLHLRAEDGAAADAASQTARNHAAASAFLDAHKELRQSFDGAIVIAEKAGSDAFVTEQRMSEVR
jgi:hypothetical protein